MVRLVADSKIIELNLSKLKICKFDKADRLERNKFLKERVEDLIWPKFF